MANQQLTFLGSPLSLGFSILAILVTAWLGYHAWQRSGRAKSQAGLEVLRLAIVTLVALLLNQPEWVQQYRPDSQPTVAVLWDNSASMATRDVDISNQSPISRTESISELIDPSNWDSLRRRFNVMVEPISGPESDSADEAATNLYQPLNEVSQRENLIGVVLVSDGDWNDGPPPVESASEFRLRNIPIIAVPTGSTQRLPDIELANVQLPTFGVAGKTIRIPFSVVSSLSRPYLTNITCKTSDGQTQTKQVQVAPMGRTNDFFLWKPNEVGDFMVTVDVPLQSKETITTNNQRTAPISIREEQLKVLIIESTPRWEYRYLRNALSRDPGVEVSCLLFHPGLQKVGGGSEDYIKVFPEELEDLVKYDVVFLGDVGLLDNQLTSDQCELLKGLVEVQASGLVFIPGWQGRQFSLLETSLKDLYPVVLDPSQIDGWGSSTPSKFQLTQRGRDSLLTKLTDAGQDNIEVWEDLPGFQWYAPVVRAKAGTEILAVHQSASNQFGRVPLLVTRTFGAGKVLFMGTDGAWRWRKGVEDKYHYRFWGQVVRWMAYQRNMARGESMRLYYSPEQPKSRQTVSLNAHVMDDGGEPLQRGEVTVRVRAPSGKTETVRLTPEGEQWGVFQGQFTPVEAGNHDVTVICDETNATLETTIFVQGDEREQIGKPARPDVLVELARVSGGSVAAPDDLKDVLNRLAELPLPPPDVKRLQLWCHPGTAAVLVILLATFWIWRKSAGFV